MNKARWFVGYAPLMYGDTLPYPFAWFIARDDAKDFLNAITKPGQEDKYVVGEIK